MGESPVPESDNRTEAVSANGSGHDPFGVFVCRYVSHSRLHRMRSLYLLHLDRDHLGDPTFIKSLAQEAGQAPSGTPPCVMVHGSGEKVERTLEAEGYFPERVNGILQVETDAQRRLVERAVREMNQDLVGTLTDEVVSTVGIQGVDRGLLALDDAGTLHAGTIGWVEALIKQRVLPVVSALARTPGDAPVREVPTADVVTVLADAFADAFDPTAVFLGTTGRPGIPGEEGIRDDLSLDAVTDAHVSDPEAVRRVCDAGIPALLTSVRGFYADDGPTGTRIVP